MAERTVVLVDGKLRARSPYREVLSVGAPISNGSQITLPNSGTYTGNELVVALNGSILKPGAGNDYTFFSTTQITILQDLVIGDELEFFKVHNP